MMMKTMTSKNPVFFRKNQMSSNCDKSNATQKKSSFSAKLVCGAVAGVIGTTIIFPLDIIKTRLQNQKPVPGKLELPYNGM